MLTINWPFWDFRWEALEEKKITEGKGLQVYFYTCLIFFSASRLYGNYQVTD